MRPSIAVFFLLFIVWSGALSAQDRSCDSFAKGIRYEGLYPYDSAKSFLEDVAIPPGQVNWLFWEDGCLLVKTTTGVWGYADGAIISEPQSIVRTKADEWLNRIMRKHPNGSWGMMESAFAYSHDGQCVVRRVDRSGRYRTVLEILDYASRTVLDSVNLNFNFYFNALAFSHDDRYIIGFSSYGQIYRWSVEDLSIPPEAILFNRSYGAENWFGIPRNDILTVPLIVGDMIYTSHSDGTVSVLNWRTDELVRILQGPRGAITQLVYQAEDDRLILYN